MTPKYDLTKTYTTDQVADILKCTQACVQRKARDREFPVIITGRKVLIPTVHKYKKLHSILCQLLSLIYNWDEKFRRMAKP